MELYALIMPEDVYTVMVLLKKCTLLLIILMKSSIIMQAGFRLRQSMTIRNSGRQSAWGMREEALIFHIIVYMMISIILYVIISYLMIVRKLLSF